MPKDKRNEVFVVFRLKIPVVLLGAQVSDRNAKTIYMDRNFYFKLQVLSIRRFHEAFQP